MKHWFKSGKPYIWLTAGAVSVSLIAVLGLLALIAWRGLSYCWPAAIQGLEVKAHDGLTQIIIGEIYEREAVSIERLQEDGLAVSGNADEMLERWLLKIGNREYMLLDL